MSPSEPIIAVEGLTRAFRTYKKRPGFWGGVRGLFARDYEETLAVDGVSFQIAPGEFVGFLGPNGAGKTTTLKMLSGLIYPTGGVARVGGFIPKERRNEFRRIFALVLGQKNQLWWDLPAQESFLLLRHIYGLERTVFDKRVEELTSLLGVRDKLGVMVRELSLGERMKMELIAALIHDPRILFLDEPTIGLDVVSQRAVREFLRDYNRRRGVTIILTSHYMADIQSLCDRVIIINKGRAVYDGALDRLDLGDGAQKIIRFRPAGPWPKDWICPGTRMENEPGQIALRVPVAEAVAVSQGILATAPVEDITIEDMPLEDVIHALFSRR